MLLVRYAFCALCVAKSNKISNVNTNYVYMIVWCAVVVGVAVACAAYIILSLVGCQIVVVLGATRLCSDI